MASSLRGLARDLLPPFVVRGARALFPAARGKRAATAPHGEKDPEWYDEHFESAGHWRRHYTESHYFFLWSVIADRMLRAGVGSVLDVGCGPGQVAALLRDKGIQCHWGVDFSAKRIEQARTVCPDFTFIVSDAFQADVFERLPYDAVLATEFLEHVERDLDLVRRVRPGARFHGTVPNFPYVSHVRHFAGVEEVRARYGGQFLDVRVDAFLADPRGKTYFVIEGVKA